jgi:hypothetical protein
MFLSNSVHVSKIAHITLAQKGCMDIKLQESLGNNNTFKFQCFCSSRRRGQEILWGKQQLLTHSSLPLLDEHARKSLNCYNRKRKEMD